MNRETSMSLSPVMQQLQGLVRQPEALGSLPVAELEALDAALQALGLSGHGDDGQLAHFNRVLDGLLAAYATAVDPVPEPVVATGAVPALTKDDAVDIAFDAEALEALLAFAGGYGPAEDARADGRILPPGGNAFPAGRGAAAFAALHRAWLDGGEPGRRSDGELQGLQLSGATERGTGDRPPGAPVLLQDLLGGQWGQPAAASGVQSLSGATAAAATPGQAPGGTGLTQSPGTAAWGQGLAERVSWMAREGVARADLALNPPRLGPLEIRLRMDGDQVTLNFVSQSSQVRDALEQALPRLREYLAEGGLELADADIGSGARGDEAHADTDPDSAGTGESSDVPADNPGPEQTGKGHGLVDLYA